MTVNVTDESFGKKRGSAKVRRSAREQAGKLRRLEDAVDLKAAHKARNEVGALPLSIVKARLGFE